MNHQRYAAPRPHIHASPFILWFGFGVGILFVLLGLYLFATQTGVSGSHADGNIEFTVNDFSGEPVQLSHYRGHPVLVNLWATWCPPCRAEMPVLIQFYREHQNEGLVLLAVNSQDDLTPAQQFVQKMQMPFVVLYDPRGQVMDAFAAKGMPSTYYIDRKGNLRFAWTGEISKSVLEQRVVPLLTQ